ncbi:inhibitor of KinA [Halobacillus dabanensis]|uniref:Inhibitor of KinA n=1 Tax=Halobacillus dabanensis TaxID=240302 RepID=A0A1I3XMY9_HALDA|nr:5-oxoprolinase subunit PxpB [Halobacillus dabanensis]SFK20912.1 inhibitor of KinA [Halobacillus dabanensis]
MEQTMHPLGDQALIIDFGDRIDEETNYEVRKVASHLDREKPDWMVEYIPAFTTVTIFYDPFYIANHISKANQLPYDWVQEEMRHMLSELKDHGQTSRSIDIPVCYGGELGPDLPYVAKRNNMTEEEVIATHMEGEYLVYMIGFAPGFPYIGGMDKKIATPRRDDPRLTIPAGSVGIAGEQTGVYPIETPGGWQLIGRTPVKLFDPKKETPSLLQAGDRIRFTRINAEDYKEMKEDEE